MQYLAIALLAALSATAATADREVLPNFATGPRVEHVHGIAGDSDQKLTDSQIRKLLIKESIDAYDGNCPCPYNRASNGSRCGKRSAYDRAGGEEPLCFDRDVNAEMVQEYRDRM